jgi:hypothetical protein
MRWQGRQRLPSKPYDPKASELSLATDAVDGVAKGDRGPRGLDRRRNRKQHRRARAANGRDERGLALFPLFARAAIKFVSKDRKIARAADLTLPPALPRVVRRKVKSKATLESYGC